VYVRLIQPLAAIYQ